ATDSYGNIYVVDVLFHTVQIFDPAGNFLYNFGEQGRGDGQFWMPSGIYIDEKDFIYIADSYNARVQIFKLVNGG
ncbi:MAG: 6-bladed beta-propeller, partial [Cyclobacteriaceae bacterium]|nr:6-bladed beta-propeller [Cyclobacteriaceae bacterium]